MQRTLFSCGVEKKIKSSAGRIYDVTSSMPSFVKRRLNVMHAMKNLKVNSTWTSTSCGNIKKISMLMK